MQLWPKFLFFEHSTVVYQIIAQDKVELTIFKFPSAKINSLKVKVDLLFSYETLQSLKGSNLKPYLSSIIILCMIMQAIMMLLIIPISHQQMRFFTIVHLAYRTPNVLFTLLLASFLHFMKCSLISPCSL